MNLARYDLHAISRNVGGHCTRRAMQIPAHLRLGGRFGVAVAGLVYVAAIVKFRRWQRARR